MNEPSDDDYLRENLALIWRELMDRQEPLGKPIEDALFEGLEDLYEE